MSETARRLHILYELKRRGKLSRSQIEESYGVEHMLKVRLERLVNTHQLAIIRDHFVLQKKTLCRISKLLMQWGNLIGFHEDVLK